mmetsp:Transcript_6326/g.10928  ORF Transcript_6326/g.10928 Transcript_6326/m.10928 type:complete len:426 (-) Transcript_6326:358-1635(-)
MTQARGALAAARARHAKRFFARARRVALEIRAAAARTARDAHSRHIERRRLGRAGHARRQVATLVAAARHFVDAWRAAARRVAVRHIGAARAAAAVLATTGGVRVVHLARVARPAFNGVGARDGGRTRAASRRTAGRTRAGRRAGRAARAREAARRTVDRTAVWADAAAKRRHTFGRRRRLHRARLSVHLATTAASRTHETGAARLRVVGVTHFGHRVVVARDGAPRTRLATQRAHARRGAARLARTSTVAERRVGDARVRAAAFRRSVGDESLARVTRPAGDFAGTRNHRTAGAKRRRTAVGRTGGARRVRARRAVAAAASSRRAARERARRCLDAIARQTLRCHASARFAVGEHTRARRRRTHAIRLTHGRVVGNANVLKRRVGVRRVGNTLAHIATRARAAAKRRRRCWCRHWRRTELIVGR